MGVVSLPSAVTGLAAISIMAEMTFMPGRHSSSKFSHVAGASGLAWRLISNLTVLVAMFPQKQLSASSVSLVQIPFLGFKQNTQVHILIAAE